MSRRARAPGLRSASWRGLCLLLAPLLASMACLTPVAGVSTTPTSGAGLISATATTAFVASPAGPTPSQAQPAGTPTAAALQVVLGPGAFVLTDTKAGLADLSGYTATLTLSFEGTQAGQARRWTKTTVMLARREPAARQLTLAQGGDAAPRLYLADVDGTAYERRGSDPCTAAGIVLTDTLADRYEPALALNPLAGADEAGQDTVNGALAKHYTFDERALARSGFSKSTGDVWVAADGGYIVRYVLTTTAGAEYFGPGTEGALTVDYELTGANQAPVIEVPADCPAGLIHVPLLPDAANVRSLPGLLTFDSGLSITDAGAFYQAQLPPLGWELAPSSLITDTAAALAFAQGSSQLAVMATTNQGRTAIRIVQTR